MSLLEAPYPVILLKGEEQVANPLAQGLPLPHGDLLEWEGRAYRVARLETPEGTYLILLEVSDLLVRAKAFTGLLQVPRASCSTRNRKASCKS